MPSKASPVAAAGRNPEMENSLLPSSLAVRKDMNAGAAPDVAGNCHCVAAGGLSGAHAIDRSQSEILRAKPTHVPQEASHAAALANLISPSEPVKSRVRSATGE